MAGHYLQYRIWTLTILALLVISCYGQNIQVADVITGDFSLIGDLKVSNDGGRYYIIHSARDSIYIIDNWVALNPYPASYFVGIHDEGSERFIVEAAVSKLLPIKSSILLFTGFNADTFFISDTVFVKEGPPNSVNLLILKCDLEGNFIRGKHFPSPFDTQPGVFDVYALEENIYITGTCDLDTMQLDACRIGGWTGIDDVFVAELNSDFECKWLTRLGGDFGRDFPLSIDVNSSLGVLTAGYFESGYFKACEDTLVNPYAAFTTDGYMSIMDFNGDCTWVESVKGISNQSVRSAKYLSDGSVVVGGVHWGDADFGEVLLEGTVQKTNGFIAKYNLDKSVEFAHQLDATGNHSVTQLEVMSNDNFWVCGTFDSSPLIIGDYELLVKSPGKKDVYVAKYDRNGNVLFAQSFGGKGSDFNRKMVKGPNNSIFVVMETKSDTLYVGDEILVLDSEFDNAVVIRIDDTTTSVGTLQPPIPHIHIYPNPVSTRDQIFIDFDQSPQANLRGITLFDIRGQMIRSYTLGDGQPLTLQVPDIATGIYILNFDFGTYRVSEKIVVVR